MWITAKTCQDVKKQIYSVAFQYFHSNTSLLLSKNYQIKMSQLLNPQQRKFVCKTYHWSHNLTIQASLLFCPTFCSHIVCIQRQCPHSWRISQVSQQIKYGAIGCCTLFSFPSVYWDVRGSWPQLEDECCCTPLLCHGVQEGSKWHWETLRLSQMGSLQPCVTLYVQNRLNFKVACCKYSQEI